MRQNVVKLPFLTHFSYPFDAKLPLHYYLYGVPLQHDFLNKLTKTLTNKKMKQKLFRLMLAVAAVLTLGNLQAASKKVHTIGDSTQEQRATDGSTDKRGWTQMLQQFIDASQFTINNRGKSGASSKSYYQ